MKKFMPGFDLKCFNDNLTTEQLRESLMHNFMGDKVTHLNFDQFTSPYRPLEANYEQTQFNPYDNKPYMIGGECI